VPATKDPAGKVYLWLPLLQQDDYQKIERPQIESAVAHTEPFKPDSMPRDRSRSMRPKPGNTRRSVIISSVRTT